MKYAADKMPSVDAYGLAAVVFIHPVHEFPEHDARTIHSSFNMGSKEQRNSQLTHDRISALAVPLLP